jgi:hypothetical protein
MTFILIKKSDTQYQLKNKITKNAFKFNYRPSTVFEKNPPTNTLSPVPPD